MPREIQAIRKKYGSPQVISLVEGVFIRPKMYTIGGTVFEVAAFLEGYFSCATRSDPKLEYWVFWGDFNTWLLAEIDNELQGDWHLLYQKVSELYPQADEAFDYLLEKVIQFQKENKTQSRV